MPAHVLSLVTTVCELAALAAFAVALIWCAALVPGPWAGPAVAAAVGVSLVAFSALLMIGRKGAST